MKRMQLKNYKMYRPIAAIVTVCILLGNGVLSHYMAESSDEFTHFSPENWEKSIETKHNLSLNKEKHFEESECPSVEIEEKSNPTFWSSLWAAERSSDEITDELLTFDFPCTEISNAEKREDSFSHNIRKRAVITDYHEFPNDSSKTAVVGLTQILLYRYGITYDLGNKIASTFLSTYGNDLYSFNDIEQRQKFASVCQQYGLDYNFGVDVFRGVQGFIVQNLFACAYANPSIKLTIGQATLSGFLMLRFDLPADLALRIAVAITLDYGSSFSGLNFFQQREVIRSICESYGIKEKKDSDDIAIELLTIFQEILPVVIDSDVAELPLYANDPNIELSVGQLSAVQILFFNFNVDFKVAIKIVQRVKSLIDFDFTRLPFIQQAQQVASILRDEFGFDYKFSLILGIVLVLKSYSGL